MVRDLGRCMCGAVCEYLPEQPKKEIEIESSIVTTRKQKIQILQRSKTSRVFDKRFQCFITASTDLNQ